MIAQSGVPFGFDYTAADGATSLYVRAMVYDISSGEAVFITKLTMDHVASGVYATTYTADEGLILAVIKEVCSDDLMTMIDQYRSPATDVFQIVDIIGNQSLLFNRQVAMTGKISSSTELVGQLVE
jgi:hypothetical protein